VLGKGNHKALSNTRLKVELDEMARHLRLWRTCRPAEWVFLQSKCFMDELDVCR